jgi:hypothetical protein
MSINLLALYCQGGVMNVPLCSKKNPKNFDVNVSEIAAKKWKKTKFA